MKEIMDKLVELLRKHGVKRAEIFGSFARGEMRRDSDLDVVVEFSEPKSLLEIVGIERELTEELGVKVDLLTSGSISPLIGERIEREKRVILDGRKG